jgi:hypothetical protein
MGVYKLSNVGGFKSQTRYTSMLAGNETFEPTAYFQIATATPTSGTTYTFSSIPQTYKHLQLRMVSADNRSTVYSANVLGFNGDFGGNYSMHQIGWQPSAVFVSGNINQTNGVEMTGSGSSAGPSFTTAVWDILDYTNTNKNTTVKAIAGQLTSSPQVSYTTGAWYNTAAVTSLHILNAASSWRSGTHFALYGIKG